MTGFSIPATPQAQRAQSRGLKLACDDMKWRGYLEQTEMTRFHATHRRFPTADEWVAITQRMYDVAGPRKPACYPTAAELGWAA